MKTTTVPAQVTTLEDRIAGRLGLSQLLLLIAPIFLDSALYVALPPFFHTADYKLVIMTIILVICAILAIRIKGKILMLWLVILSRYYFRPRYYIFNKNTAAGRGSNDRATVGTEESEAEQTVLPHHIHVPLPTSELARLQTLIHNPAAKLSFITTKKGGLSVHITKVEEQS